MTNPILQKLSEVEELFAKENIDELLVIWPELKSKLNSLSLEGKVRFQTNTRRAFFSRVGFFIWIRSSFIWLLNLTRKSKSVCFFGAASGLFKKDISILDSYRPKVLDDIDYDYYLNCVEKKSLYERKYYKDKNIILENFVILPFVAILNKTFNILTHLGYKKNIYNQAQVLESILFEKNLPYSKEKIISLYLNFWSKVLCYKILLFRKKYQKAYVVSAYSKCALLFVLKKRKVSVIEVQHSFVGAGHPGYNYNSILKNLPFNNSFPDAIGVYNDFWRRELLNFKGIWDGNMIYDFGRVKYDVSLPFLHPHPFMIFTGQGGFFQEWVDLFSNLSLEIKNRGLNIQIIYIPHPRESLTELDWLQNKITNFESVLIYQGKETTESLIRSSIAHVSVFSSCHFDAIHYNNKTFVFDIIENNLMREYEVNHPGKFHFFKKADELLNMAEVI